MSFIEPAIAIQLQYWKHQPIAWCSMNLLLCLPGTGMHLLGHLHNCQRFLSEVFIYASTTMIAPASFNIGTNVPFLCAATVSVAQHPFANKESE